MTKKTIIDEVDSRFIFSTIKLPDGRMAAFLDPQIFQSDHVGGFIVISERLADEPTPHPSESGSFEPSLGELMEDPQKGKLEIE
jgi:hypothetical protein